MSRAAVFTLIFLVVWGVFTAVFAASAPKNQVRLLPKWVWAIACVIVPFFGGLLYLMVGRPVSGSGLGNAGGRGGANPRGRNKVVAPDDDPRFLRDLEKKLREKGAEGGGEDSVKGEATGAGDGAGTELGDGAGTESGDDSNSDDNSKPKDS